MPSCQDGTLAYRKGMNARSYTTFVMISIFGGFSRCFLTAQSSAERINESRYFSGNPAGIWISRPIISNIDSRAGPDGREEYLKRTGGSSRWRLVSRHSERTKMSVHARTAGEVDNHFHEFYLRKYRFVFGISVYWMIVS